MSSISKNSSPSTLNIMDSETIDKQEDMDQNLSADDGVFGNRNLSWGWRSFRPSWLQWLNSANWFVFFVGWFTFLQDLLQHVGMQLNLEGKTKESQLQRTGNLLSCHPNPTAFRRAARSLFYRRMTVNSLVNVALPTLEKRFKLNSKQTGFIISSNDITALILVVFVSFLGSYGHKTKWLGFGAIVTGIGALIFALPKFLIGKYQPSELKSAGSFLCFLNSTSIQDNDCSDESSSTSLYYFLFVLSQLLAGVGTTPLFPLGPAYIDDNVHPKRTSFYLGIFYLSFFLGPSVGSIIGGRLLSIHVDLFMQEDLNLTPADPRWIGAWWVGPFCCGLILILIGFILLGFPFILPGSVEMRAKAIAKGYIKKDEQQLTGSLKHILPSTKALLTNWTFFFQTLGFTFTLLVGLGVGPFIFKLLVGRYGASFTEAGIGVASILLPGAAIGIFLGSFVTKKLGVRNSCKKATKVTFFLQLIGVWGSLNFLIPGCDYAQYAGVDVGYGNSSLVKASLQSQCNSRCDCSASKFRPVCAPNGVNYFSPCFAGCSQHIPNKGYTNCSCVSPSFNVSANHTLVHSMLVEGVCLQECNRLYYYLFIIGNLMAVVLGFSNSIPSKVVILRSVPNNLRGYALGIQFVFVRILAGLPGPVLIGAIIDETCTLWSTRCGRPENCLNYDFYKLGWIITVYGFPPQALSLLFYFLSWHLCKDTEVTFSNTGEYKMAEKVMNRSEDQHYGLENDKKNDSAGQGFANSAMEMDNTVEITKF